LLGTCQGLVGALLGGGQGPVRRVVRAAPGRHDGIVNLRRARGKHARHELATDEPLTSSSSTTPPCSTTQIHVLDLSWDHSSVKLVCPSLCASVRKKAMERKLGKAHVNCRAPHAPTLTMGDAVHRAPGGRPLILLGVCLFGSGKAISTLARSSTDNKTSLHMHAAALHHALDFNAQSIISCRTARGSRMCVPRRACRGANPTFASERGRDPLSPPQSVQRGVPEHARRATIHLPWSHISSSCRG